MNPMSPKMNINLAAGLVETKSRIGSTVVTPINNKNTLFRGPSIRGISMGDAFGYTAAELDEYKKGITDENI